MALKILWYMNMFVFFFLVTEVVIWIVLRHVGLM